METTKILYVEDEPFLGKIVKESLESRAYKVHMVADGDEVLAAMEAFGPDICVLDVMLPNRDGFEIARDIRRLRPNLPILFVSAKNQTEDVLQGFSSGGNDYVRKPFSMEELIVRVNNLLALSRSQQQQSSKSRDGVPVGEFTFFPMRYELQRNDKVRKLSAREADLLKILIESRHFTIARKDILMKVWGDDHFFNSRNLDVYITKLRDYLREDPNIKIITIKGVGYHFTF